LILLCLLYWIFFTCMLFLLRLCIFVETRIYTCYCVYKPWFFFNPFSNRIACKGFRLKWEVAC
jgi:hypothetical protein